MNKRFEKRLKFARNPRLRRRNQKKPRKFKSPTSTVDLICEEIKDDLRQSTDSVPLRGSPKTAPVYVTMDGVSVIGHTMAKLAVASAIDAKDAILRHRKKQNPKKTVSTRKKYYEAEAIHRKLQKKLLEAARKKPTCKCPTPAKLTEAYLRRRESDDWKERFGTLMIDLEEHVRRTFLISGNKFTGSAGGVKDWLSANCPLLAKHYATCQRYKRLFQDDPCDE